MWGVAGAVSEQRAASKSVAVLLVAGTSLFVIGALLQLGATGALKQKISEIFKTKSK